MAGIWLPHTSSIEFCEANYLLSRHVAEPFNAGSSLLLAIMPLIGLWAGNPTGELRWTVHWLLFVVVGLGSVCLHATLSALGQALDEVPMVWLAISFLGLMVETQGRSWLPLALVAAAACQTLIYARFRQYFLVFLASYVSCVIVIVCWAYQWGSASVAPSAAACVVRRALWRASLKSYVLLGVSLWLFEMVFCDALQPFFNAAGGLSFHILWHIGAALGSFAGGLVLAFPCPFVAHPASFECGCL